MILANVQSVVLTAIGWGIVIAVLVMIYLTERNDPTWTRRRDG